MLGWISKLFKRKKMKQNGKNDEYSLDGLDQAALAKVKIRRQFEIYVEEYDEPDNSMPAEVVTEQPVFKKVNDSATKEEIDLFAYALSLGS